MINSVSLSLAFLKCRGIPFDYLIDALSLTSYAVINASGTTLGTYSNSATSSGLKAAIDSVKAAGKHLHFVGGKTYRFLDNVAGQDHANLSGLVGLIFSSNPADRATIEGFSNATSGDSDPLSFNACDHSIIRDLVVSGLGSGRAASNALRIENSDHVTLENIKVSGSRGSGIAFDASAVGATSDNNVVRNCEVVGTQTGDGLRFVAATGSLVEDTLIHDCAGSGIKIAASGSKKSSGVKVRGCTVERNAMDGIRILSSDNCVVGSITKSNLIRDNASGVRVATTQGVAANDNVIEFNIITDSRSGASKTQLYGVDIRPDLAPLASGTVVRNNALAGNKTAPLYDGGVGSVISANSL